LALAVGVAGPLLYAAVSKPMDPSRFAAALHRFDLAFLRPSSRSAQVVGLFELMTGVVLVLWPSPTSALIAVVVYLGLALVLLRTIRAGSSGDCGCFGALAGGIDARGVLRNIALGVACLGLAFVRRDELLGTYEVSTAVLVLSVVTLAAAAIDTVLEVRKRIA
jgi:hypothetical protein